MCPLASASAAAVPDVAITSPTRGVPSFFSALRNSRSINCFNRATSSFAGGSLCRNSSCNRTAPNGIVTIVLMRPPSDNVTSQLPPPKSISRHFPRAPTSCVTTPR